MVAEFDEGVLKYWQERAERGDRARSALAEIGNLKSYWVFSLELGLLPMMSRSAIHQILKEATE